MHFRRVQHRLGAGQAIAALTLLLLAAPGSAAPRGAEQVDVAGPVLFTSILSRANPASCRSGFASAQTVPHTRPVAAAKPGSPRPSEGSPQAAPARSEDGAGAADATKQHNGIVLAPGGIAVLAAVILGLLALCTRQARIERRWRRRSEASIRMMQSLLDGSPLALIAWNRDRGIVFWSGAAERMFGLARESVLGRAMPEALRGFRQALESSLEASETVSSLPLELPDVDGTRKHVAVSASRLPASREHAATYAAVVEDTTPRRMVEQRRLDEVRAQRDALVREVHHRIKNHLQGVAGLLRQHQSRAPALGPVLESATAQVLSIAAVHGLQGELPGAALDLAALVARIASAICGIMQVSITQGESCAELEGVTLVEAEAVPIAMVLNEIIMNAVKHRGIGQSMTSVRIDVEREGELLKIRVSNPGTLPVRMNLALDAPLGTGLDLARSLVPQRGAALSLEADRGMVVATLALSAPHVVTMPAPRSASQAAPQERRA